MFITFEGIDACGKDTQIELLKQHIKDTPVVLTREPGGTSLADRIRKLLLDPALPMDTVTETMLLNAARHDHVEKRINPALDSGITVICNRYTDSTRAYQDEGYSIHAHNFPVPDLTIFIDITVEESNKRLKAGGVSLDRIESKDDEYKNIVRQRYLNVMKADPERCVIINGQQSIEEVSADIIQAYQNKLLKPDMQPTLFQ